MTDLTTPIAPDPSDPGNWREIQRLQRLAESEGRVFDPEDPYNWKGISALQAGAPSSAADAAGTTTAGTTADPNVTAPASTPGSGTDVTIRNKAVFDSVSNLIQDAGLGGLFTIGPDGAPGGRLWEQITSGMDSESALIVWFEDQPEFQARFPAIAQARSKGSGYVPTPRDVRVYEEDAERTLRLAGLPSWFYDDPVQDLQKLMAADISVAELEDRLGESWTAVRNTDPAVMSMFSEFFGVQGDAAMAAFFLDPTRTLQSINRAARTAYTAGMGSTMGLDIDMKLADRIASLPSTYSGIWTDLQTVGRLTGSGGVFDENFGEVTDLTAEGEGIGAVMLGDGEASAAINRRIIERKAIETSSQGGAALTEAGLTGVASA